MATQDDTSSCRHGAAVRVSLADQSTVLVASRGFESTLRSRGVALGHIAGAGALAVALGTAEVAGEATDANGDLVGFAARGWVAVVGGVGRHGHLQDTHLTCPQDKRTFSALSHSH